ncbi:MAG: FemAB family XrtA/PEP-CTERM system-associated protein, partial [Pseudomonadota bacterium]
AAEADKDALRKQLSREIGQAKKRNEDCAPLIDQVSDLSSEIKALKAKQEQATEKLQGMLSLSSSQTEALSSTPRHFSDASANQPAVNHTVENFTVSQCHEPKEWQNFVDACGHAHLYHDARWHSLIERNFGQQTYPLVCYDHQGNITGVMPLIHLQSRLFGSFAVSIPYFNYGGPLANDPAVENLLMTHAAELCKEFDLSHMEIRETAPRDGWLCSQKKVSMVLKLPGADDALDKQLGSKLRAQVKRAAGHDLVVTTGNDARHVKDFYAVYSHNMRDLGTPAYGLAFFQDIAKTFSEQCFVTVVRQGNKTLAAGFLLGYQDKLEIPWASSLRTHNHLGANMLMYRAVLSEAIKRGYDFFDFGRSTRDASTYKFKKQWGATEYPLYWHYWTQENKLPEINPDNPKYKLVIAAWQRLPVPVTRMIGPWISRNLP